MTLEQFVAALLVNANLLLGLSKDISIEDKDSFYSFSHVEARNMLHMFAYSDYKDIALDYEEICANYVGHHSFYQASLIKHLTS